MSSMLEQAIVDAQALREAALKNAEQALIEKFAPQIKEAVESLLETGASAGTKRKVSYEGKNYSLMEIDEGKATIMREGEKPFVVESNQLSEELDEELLQEEEVDMGKPEGEEEMLEPFDDMPYAHHPDDSPVVYDIEMSDIEFELDLGRIDGNEDVDVPQESYDDVAGGLDQAQTAPDAGGDAGAGGLDLGGLDLQEDISEQNMVSEIMNIINELDDESQNEELLEEELIVDMGEVKDGTFQTNEAMLEYYAEMQSAKEYAEAKEEENEGLKETLKKFKLKNKQYKDAVEKLSEKLNETMLSNAKLIYSNKTLGDASLNERQKSKIVEAIAKARTPEEAKNLHEALNATVTSGNDRKSTRTLSESVQRKSTLSGILPRRNKQANESETHTFADKMKKLAGIK
jgi:hypothetical protein